MIGIAALMLLQTQATVSIGAGTKKGASVGVQMRGADDSTRRDTTRRRAAVVTPALLASAYKDAASRSMISRAREARLSQDSSLRNYDATTLQRLTAGLGLSRFGRERMLFRYESSSKVKWQRGVGALVEITGRRAVAPSFGKNVIVEVDAILSPVPYFPGRDALWAGSATVRDEISGDEIVHPLATPGEAYYVYETGDSARFRLADGTTIRLREVLVRPRVVDWRAVVGSLWFDVASGQLVRGAYKFSEPLDLWKAESDSTNDTPFMVKAMLDPATAAITGVAVEYGLHEGKFWLPRTQAFAGVVQLGFMRLPMQIEETYAYNGVNIRDLAVVVPAPRSRMDTTALEGLTGGARDSARARMRRTRDSTERVDDESECARNGVREERVRRHHGALIVGLLVPCDNRALAESPTLPKSIFDDNDEFFSDAMRDELLARAEGLLSIPTLGFYRKPTVKWTFNQLRFNRVEGLSSSLLIEQSLGQDLSARALPRIGVADRIPSGELSLIRKRAHSDFALTGYRRLIADTEWGDPLSFGSSLSAMLFGRDEGMYYRGTGGELSGVWYRSIRTFWSVYAQRESDAVARNSRSLPELLGGDGFTPAANITAQQATQYGSTLRLIGSRGRDPDGWRTLADVRLDGATGDFDYGRASMDFTVAHGLFAGYGASLTMSGGSSIGSVPVQRLYYLGGSSTVRGESVGTMSGNAYWFGRAELGRGLAARRVLFADIGWAGDRDNLENVGRPMSGVGVGFSVLDGLFRFDIARGLYPEKQFRVTLYLDSRY